MFPSDGIMHSAGYNIILSSLSLHNREKNAPGVFIFYITLKVYGGRGKFGHGTLDFFFYFYFSPLC